MSYDELYDLTPRSFSNKYKGYNKNKEIEMRSNWERTRVLVHTSLMPHLKKKMKAKEVMPFEWDNEKTVKKDIATKEEIEKVIQKYRDKNINIISNGIKKGNSKARS